MFALVDANNFYVSCHRLFNPALKGRPVVVLSNNDGCCVARSNEVKALGVKMGTPWFQLQDLAVEAGIIAFSSNYALYGDISSRFMQVLKTFSPQQEIYSIDECFLDFGGFKHIDLRAYGHEMRERVAQWLGLPVCVGIAPTKTLAKLANHVAKKQLHYQGVFNYAALNTEQQVELCASIPASEVWGIGRRISERLQALGIVTVQDLRTADPKRLRQHFGVVVERTARELNGISCLALEDCTPPKQSIVVSRSFGKAVQHLPELKEALACYTSRAAEKLRQQHSVAESLQVFIRTNPHKPSDPQYAASLVLPLASPTANTLTLAKVAQAGLEKLYKTQHHYQKVGVMLLGLRQRDLEQGDLFADDAVSSAKSQQLMTVLDTINRRMGRGTLRLASEGYHHGWRTRSAYQSPRYTSSWQELAIAHAK